MEESPSRPLTTGKAARLLGVEPDTVLKWIKRGKLRASKTTGGHHRIDAREVDRLLHARASGNSAMTPEQCRFGPLRCWEYFAGQGEVHAECLECVVYRVRASLCFELLHLQPELAPDRRPCAATCSDCAYYQRVHGEAVRILLISEDPDLLGLVLEPPDPRLQIAAARTAYEASRAVGSFRPAFAVVDRECASLDWKELTAMLSSDDRCPGLRVLLAAGASSIDPGSPPPAGTAALIAKPFGINALLELVGRFPVESLSH